MGCMNGKCSDDPDSTDRDVLVSRQPRHNSLDYSVKPLPESPSVNEARSLEDATGYLTNGFEESTGGTQRRELGSQHLITSNNSGSELKPGNDALM